MYYSISNTRIVRYLTLVLGIIYLFLSFYFYHKAHDNILFFELSIGIIMLSILSLFTLRSPDKNLSTLILCGSIAFILFYMNLIAIFFNQFTLAKIFIYFVFIIFIIMLWNIIKPIYNKKRI
jgi:uncharacterized membrane protein YGL010W